MTRSEEGAKGEQMEKIERSRALNVTSDQSAAKMIHIGEGKAMQFFHIVSPPVCLNTGRMNICYRNQ